MSLIRNWTGTQGTPDSNKQTILETGWKRVLIKRTSTISQKIGSSYELDEEDITFEIKARIDQRTDSDTWIGLVEPHILPLMSKGDKWYTEKPNALDIQAYKVESIHADEINLVSL
jgi:hypothetical protein